MADTHCSTTGIDSIGKSMPDSMTMGMSSTMADMSSAMSWLLAMLEMSSPSERASRM